MGKKKSTTKGGSADTRSIVLSLKGTVEFRDWLNELAEHCRTTAVNVMEIAVINHAKATGFKKPAPKRTEGR